MGVGTYLWVHELPMCTEPTYWYSNLIMGVITYLWVSEVPLQEHRKHRSRTRQSSLEVLWETDHRIQPRIKHQNVIKNLNITKKNIFLSNLKKNFFFCKSI